MTVLAPKGLVIDFDLHPLLRSEWSWPLGMQVRSEQKQHYLSAARFRCHALNYLQLPARALTERVNRAAICCVERKSLGHY